MMEADIGSKRKCDEWDVSEIEKSNEACVHGVPVVVGDIISFDRLLMTISSSSMSRVCFT